MSKEIEGYGIFTKKGTFVFNSFKPTKKQCIKSFLKGRMTWEKAQEYGWQCLPHKERK